ncbi:DUF732 domain-containing protein [Nocardia harenae]|uniref:DUF732 domain-containing protein n=1 Tax=Nocardia harenae TaxID=358707 RepID=UPI0008375BA7|nr:DUF732 domain-containing protein [Nocardia harenae]
MHRTRGKVMGVAVALAATGLLAACGDNDSTASSTPSLSTTASAASQAPTSAAQAPDQGATPSAEVSAPPAAESPERPEPVPTDAVPPANTTTLGDRDQQFLDALAAKGVTPSTPDIALSIGAYVCQGSAAGASDQDLMTFVSAMAGSDPSFDPAKMPVEQAGKIYLDTAKQTYCS